jgi:hypothetical protein
MTARKPKTTSLWALIDRIQRRLEAEGLGDDAIDRAVAHGLGTRLDTVPPLRDAHRRHGRFPMWVAPPAVSATKA